MKNELRLLVIAILLLALSAAVGRNQAIAAPTTPACDIPSSSCSRTSGADCAR